MKDYREEYVTANGCRLWTVVQGSGAPLALLHGGPGDFDYLEPVASMVEDIARVYRYDQRGSGRSQQAQPYDVATFVDDLDALREHYAIERWIVGGHSWGAGLALAYAVKYPARVTALLYLSGTGIFPGWHDDYNREREARLSPEALVRYRKLREMRENAATPEERARIRTEMRGLTVHVDYYDISQVESLPDFDKYPPNFELNDILGKDWDRIIEEGSLIDGASGLDVPALVVHGEGDPRPRWPAEKLANLLPQARFVSLPRVGHDPWLERPALISSVLRDFLESLKPKK